MRCGQDAKRLCPAAQRTRSVRSGGCEVRKAPSGKLACQGGAFYVRCGQDAKRLCPAAQRTRSVRSGGCEVRKAPSGKLACQGGAFYVRCGQDAKRLCPAAQRTRSVRSETFLCYTSLVKLTFAMDGSTYGMDQITNRLRPVLFIGGLSFVSHSGCTCAISMPPKGPNHCNTAYQLGILLHLESCLPCVSPGDDGQYIPDRTVSGISQTQIAADSVPCSESCYSIWL